MVQAERDRVRIANLNRSRTLFKPLAIAATLLIVATGASAFSYSNQPTYAPVAYGVTKTAQYKKKSLIAPSAAARIARSVAPASKLLNVRLSGGKSPRYIVRARAGEQILKIIIDATSGAVMHR